MYARSGLHASFNVVADVVLFGCFSSLRCVWNWMTAVHAYLKEPLPKEEVPVPGAGGVSYGKWYIGVDEWKAQPADHPLAG